MPGYRVISISPDLSDKVRNSGRTPGYGHPTHTETASAFGPCRQCLAGFAEGEERRILFTFDPFFGLEDLPLPGPVFIHERTCPSYAEDAGFPEQLKHLPLTLNAYSRGRRLIDQVYVSDGDPEPAIGHLFAEDAVDYIYVRNTEAGCYICRLER